MKTETNMTNAYNIAYKKACLTLSKMNPIIVCKNSNSIYKENDNSILVKYLNKTYIVNCQSGEVIREDKKEVKSTVKVLIVHYLINAKGVPLTGEKISLKEIHEAGEIYYHTFEKRAVSPLIENFSQDLEKFINVAKTFGAVIEKYGDASVSIEIFPLIPITYVLWRADDELDASGTILFDCSVSNYLPLEDIIVAASFGVYAMIKKKYAK